MSIVNIAHNHMMEPNLEACILVVGLDNITTNY